MPSDLCQNAAVVCPCRQGSALSSEVLRDLAVVVVQGAGRGVHYALPMPDD